MCDIPYKYIIKLETFAEDYQFLMRKFGFWEKFNAKHKLIGIVKGIFDQPTLVNPCLFQKMRVKI